jgi:hypothetical protein
MSDYMFNDSAGREHLKDLIREAEQERLARKALKAQGKGQSLSRVRNLLVKAFGSFTD